MWHGSWTTQKFICCQVWIQTDLKMLWNATDSVNHRAVLQLLVGELMSCYTFQCTHFLLYVIYKNINTESKKVLPNFWIMYNKYTYHYINKCYWLQLQQETGRLESQLCWLLQIKYTPRTEWNKGSKKMAQWHTVCSVCITAWRLIGSKLSLWQHKGR